MESTSSMFKMETCDEDDVVILGSYCASTAAAKRPNQSEEKAGVSKRLKKADQVAGPSRAAATKQTKMEKFLVAVKEAGSSQQNAGQTKNSVEVMAGTSQPVAAQPKKTPVGKQVQPKKSATATKVKLAKAPAKKGRKSKAEKEEEEINGLLNLAGYENPENLSKCIRAGLIRGHFGFKFTGEAAQLDKVVLEAKCSTLEFVSDVDAKCTGTLKATVRQLLEQPDYAGYDYENDLKNAKVECDTCRKNRSYITRCCSSEEPVWDCGKFHNHCTDCKGLGVCISDYRNAHCYRCGKHYFAGSFGNFPCNCGSKRGRSKSNNCEFM